MRVWPGCEGCSVNAWFAAVPRGELASAAQGLLPQQWQRAGDERKRVLSQPSGSRKLHLRAQCAVNTSSRSKMEQPALQLLILDFFSRSRPSASRETFETPPLTTTARPATANSLPPAAPPPIPCTSSRRRRSSLQTCAVGTAETLQSTRDPRECRGASASYIITILF
jgi:hypothetical protein